MEAPMMNERRLKRVRVLADAYLEQLSALSSSERTFNAAVDTAIRELCEYEGAPRVSDSVEGDLESRRRAVGRVVVTYVALAQGPENAGPESLLDQAIVELCATEAAYQARRRLPN
jgi:hypothetical protein